MVIYLRHAKHGNKVACSNDEAIADEKNGWERYTLGSATVTVTPANDEAISTIPTLDGLSDSELAERYQAKFGKKPHHKKSRVTVIGELAALGEFHP